MNHLVVAVSISLGVCLVGCRPSSNEIAAQQARAFYKEVMEGAKKKGPAAKFNLPPKIKAKWTGMADYPTANLLLLSPDRTRLATYRDDISLWDLTTGKEYARIVDPPPSPVLAFSPDGRYLASGSHLADEFRVWDAYSGKQVLRCSVPVVRGVSFSSDGRKLVSGYERYGVAVLDIATEELEERQYSNVAYSTIAVCSPRDNLMALHRMLNLITRAQHVVEIYDVESGRIRATLEPTGYPDALVFSADGHTLAMAIGSGPIEIWDMRNYQRRDTLKPETQGKEFVHFGGLALSADGNLVLAQRVFKSGPPEPVLWDVRQKHCRDIVKRPYSAACFSPKANLLVLSDSVSGLFFLDPTTGKPLPTPPPAASLGLDADHNSVTSPSP